MRFSLFLEPHPQAHPNFNLRQKTEQKTTNTTQQIPAIFFPNMQARQTFSSSSILVSHESETRQIPSTWGGTSAEAVQALLLPLRRPTGPIWGSRDRAPFQPVSTFLDLSLHFSTFPLTPPFENTNRRRETILAQRP